MCLSLFNDLKSTVLTLKIDALYALSNTKLRTNSPFHCPKNELSTSVKKSVLQQRTSKLSFIFYTFICITVEAIF